MKHSHHSAFTLIELLIVIAIIAILSVVVILVLNPAQLLSQSRDSNRFSDIATLNDALGLYSEDVGGSTGAASTTYVSVADPSATSTVGDQCQGLGLPALPTGYNYHCAASSTYRAVGGTGWIPLNFNSFSFGSPLGILPIDPVNQTSSNLYYTYSTNGSQFEVNSVMESSKQKSKSLLANYPGVAAVGTNLSLSTLFNPNGLVGYWTFDDGAGTTAADSSGSGNKVTLMNSPTWTTGKINGGLSFNGSTQYAYATSSASQLNIAGPWTVSTWVTLNALPTSGNAEWFVTESDLNNDKDYMLGIANAYSCAGTASWIIFFDAYPTGNTAGTCYTPTTIALNTWYLITGTWDGTTETVYFNGSSFASSTTANIPASDAINDFSIGNYHGNGYDNSYTAGTIDDVRVYNRTLSPAEVLALYNEGR